jgi:hypothetical protein
MASMSCALRLKSNTCAFSKILVSFSDLGMVIKPCSTHHLIIICGTVLLYLHTTYTATIITFNYIAGKSITSQVNELSYYECTVNGSLPLGHVHQDRVIGILVLGQWTVGHEGNVIGPAVVHNRLLLEEGVQLNLVHRGRWSAGLL